MSRPHVLGIDDGPFSKDQPEPVPIVGVMMEGADLVEATALSSFPVDGDDATGFLAAWIAGLRLRPTVQAVVLGGITMAGLGVVDVTALAADLGVPVLVVTRKEPQNDALAGALTAAGLPGRIAIVEHTPAAFAARPGLWIACAGATHDEAARLARACSAKAKLPEPLRIAHLIAAAHVNGESRGRA
jgi:endonuclease V-like protein UPF0215 family